MPAFLDRFFFSRISARGFGLMRACWAFVAGAFLLMQWKDVRYYYSNAGLVTDLTAHAFMRDAYRLSVFHWFQSPEAVFVLYVATLVLMCGMMVGVLPRLTTVLSVLLLFSFHERNQMLLNGGDTLLRNVGFLLMIAPGIDSFSVSRYRMARQESETARYVVREATMPAWPWRLLLWQMIVLYGTSFWHKLLGDMWLDGTALEVPFHHPVFARWPSAFMNMLMPFAEIAAYLSLFWQGAWLLLLVPRGFMRRLLPERVPLVSLRRLLITTGILFHGSILLLLDAGVFSLSIFVAYVGLLRGEDLSWLRRSWRWLTRRRPMFRAVTQT